MGGCLEGLVCKYIVSRQYIYRGQMVRGHEEMSIDQAGERTQELFAVYHRILKVSSRIMDNRT